MYNAATEDSTRAEFASARGSLAPIPLAYYVDAYVAAKRMTRQMTSSGARRAQRNLYLFCRLAPLDPRRVRREHVLRFLERPDMITSHRTELATLRTLFEYLVFRAVVSSNPTLGIESPEQAPLPLLDPSATIADALDREILDPRSSLVISLMVCEGVRRCEIARIQLEDIDESAAIIKIRAKGAYGSVRRELPISARTARALATYKTTLNRRRGPLVGNLLSPERGVAVAHVGLIARAALDSLGIKRSRGYDITPHSLLLALAPGDPAAISE